eukprot:701981-Pleurochrysis_carterae.AAC.1
MQVWAECKSGRRAGVGRVREWAGCESGRLVILGWLRGWTECGFVWSGRASGLRERAGSESWRGVRSGGVQE